MGDKQRVYVKNHGMYGVVFAPHEEPDYYYIMFQTKNAVPHVIHVDDLEFIDGESE